MLQTLRNLLINPSSTITTTTADPPPPTHPSPLDPNPPSAPGKTLICHFLRLPTEVRLQIFSYTHLPGQIIQVLYAPVQRTEGGLVYHRTYSMDPTPHALLYRLEQGGDADTAGEETQKKEQKEKRKESRKWWCTSLAGLFALASVCRQVRGEVLDMLWHERGVALSARNHNAVRALPAFLATLGVRQRDAVREIYWPLWVLREGGAAAAGRANVVSGSESQAAWAVHIRSFTGLRCVVLRYRAGDLQGGSVGLTQEEKEEVQRLLAEGGEAYVVQREVRRRTAVRRMRAVVGEGVEINCERTAKAAF